MRQQRCLAAQVHRIEVSEDTRPATRYGELIRSCDLQQLDGVRRIAMAQRPKRPKSWQVIESDVCILRSLFQIVRQRLRPRHIPREGQNVEQAVALPDLLPQVSGLVTVRV